MTEREHGPNPDPQESTQASVPLEERGIDLAQAAVDGVTTFLGGTGGVVAGAWINSKLNPPPPPPPDPTPPTPPTPQVILPPNVDPDS